MSLFGPKPTTSLFGAPVATAAVVPQQPQRENVETIIRQSDALVRSLTVPEKYGDERDGVLTKVNQIAAALGCGSGHVRNNEAPVIYNLQCPFLRLKTITYNRLSDYQDSDGMVQLYAKNVPLNNATERQGFLDKIYVILGSRPSLRPHIEFRRSLPDGIQLIVIFVEDRISGRVSARRLSEALQQKKAELAQCGVDGERIIPRVAWSPHQIESYLRDPPIGYDAALWRQAAEENPDPAHLLPHPLRGFDELSGRVDDQREACENQRKIMADYSARLEVVSKNVAGTHARLCAVRDKQKQLSHRLLRALTAQQCSTAFARPLSGAEERLLAEVECNSLQLHAPDQLLEKLTFLRRRARLLTDDGYVAATNKTPEVSTDLTEDDRQRLRDYLVRCQEGLEALQEQVQYNLGDLNAITSTIAQP